MNETLVPRVRALHLKTLISSSLSGDPRHKWQNIWCGSGHLPQGRVSLFLEVSRVLL